MTVQANDAVHRVEANLGYRFKNPSLIREALTHPSIVCEKNSYSTDNQRLEFLGDAVLQLVLTEALYARFTEQDEGVLTKWRARLVSKPALAIFGTELELGPAFAMSKGEEAHGGRERDSTLADGVEAVLGAVYLDGGFEKAKEVILRMTSNAFESVTLSSESGNPKGELQEKLQAIAAESPKYEIISSSGPDHQKNFVVEVSWRDQLLGRGEGASKKLAQTAAAAHALTSERWLK